MADTLRLVQVGSGSSINIIGTAGYKTLYGRWSPAVATLRQDRRGNQPPYEDVVETIQLSTNDVGSDSPHQRLENLSDMLNQAVRWWNNEGSQCVYIEYEIENSILANPLRAEIIGIPQAVALPGDYEATGARGKVGHAQDPVTLQFTRRGLWLDSLGASTATVSGTANPNKMTATFAGTILASSPTKVEFTGIDALAGIDGGYAILVQDTQDVYITEAESASGSGTAVADAAGLARGGTIWRVTATTTEYSAFSYSLITTFNTCKKAAVYAAIRKNTAARSWKIYVKIQNADGIEIGRTPVTIVDTANTTPEVVYLGMALLSGNAAMNQFSVNFAPDSTSGSTTLDFDYIVFVNLDHRENRAITFGDQDTNTNGYTSLIIDHQALVEPDPIVEYGSIDLPFRGDAYVAFSGSSVTAMILAAYSTYWCIVDGAGPSNKAIGLRLTRTPGYLIPQ